MLASFVIGFHTARLNNLVQTLNFLNKWHPEVVSESQLVTICQNECEECSNQYTNHFKKWDHENLNLECMMLPKVTNRGIELCESDKIIILESDRILPQGYFHDVIADIREGVMITTDKMHHLIKPATDYQIEHNTYEYKDEARTQVNNIGQRNMWSGNTAIHKADFYKVGRMDENYVGYGWADSDMTNQMSKLGIKSIFRDEIELHLWHPKASYGTGDQKKLFVDNGVYFCKKWSIDYPIWLREEIGKLARILL